METIELSENDIAYIDAVSIAAMKVIIEQMKTIPNTSEFGRITVKAFDLAIAMAVEKRRRLTPGTAVESSA